MNLHQLGGSLWAMSARPGLICRHLSEVAYINPENWTLRARTCVAHNLCSHACSIPRVWQQLFLPDTACPGISYIAKMHYADLVCQHKDSAVFVALMQNNPSSNPLPMHAHRPQALKIVGQVTAPLGPYGADAKDLACHSSIMVR